MLELIYFLIFILVTYCVHFVKICFTKKKPFSIWCYTSIKHSRYNKIKWWLRETSELARDHTALRRPVRSSRFLLLLCSLTRKVLDNFLSILGFSFPIYMEWEENKTTVAIIKAGSRIPLRGDSAWEITCWTLPGHERKSGEAPANSLWLSGLQGRVLEERCGRAGRRQREAENQQGNKMAAARVR